MSHFHYRAITEAGALTSGLLHTTSQTKATDQLIEQGLTPISITKASSSSGRKLNITWFKHRIKANELVSITKLLAILINSQLTVSDALTAIIEQTTNQGTRSCLLDVRQQVNAGLSLAQALAGQPENFSTSYIATVKSGEASGQLGVVLTRLADYMQTRMRNRKQIFSALLYPSIVLAVSFVVVIILLKFVIPQVATVVMDNQGQLPLLTRGLLSISSTLSQHGQLILLIVGLMVLILGALYRISAMRFLLSRWLLDLPLVGTFLRAFYAAELCRTLALLCTNGVPLIDALTGSKSVITNHFMQCNITAITQDISAGRSFSSSLSQHPVFPPFVLRLITSGEAGSQLVAMLDQSGKALDEQLNNTTQMVLTLISPLTTLFMGGLVVMIVLAVLLPVFNMNDLVI